MRFWNYQNVAPVYAKQYQSGQKTIDRNCTREALSVLSQSWFRDPPFY